MHLPPSHSSNKRHERLSIKTFAYFVQDEDDQKPSREARTGSVGTSAPRYTRTRTQERRQEGTQRTAPPHRPKLTPALPPRAARSAQRGMRRDSAAAPPREQLRSGRCRSPGGNRGRRHSAATPSAVGAGGGCGRDSAAPRQRVKVGSVCLWRYSGTENERRPSGPALSVRGEKKKALIRLEINVIF